MNSMAISPNFSLIIFFLLILCSCSWQKSDAFPFRGTNTITNSSTDSLHTHHIILHVDSLLPSALCHSSTQGFYEKSALQIVHKHGPCSQQLHHQDVNATTSPTEKTDLFHDEARVRYIQSRLVVAKNSASSSGGGVKETNSAANLPASDGSAVGTGDYIVRVGLGTPTKQLSLVFDTGSDLTWTQCQPCIRYCYDQKDTIFDPSLSSTYSNVSCNSAACNSLQSATSTAPRCSASACVYGIEYGDSSFSIGFFAKERLTLTPNDVFDDFLFGCGQNNQGLYGGAAGLLGLGRDQLALPSQTAVKYDKYFSYCLPSSSSETGYLAFGKEGGGRSGKSIKFTPWSTAAGLKDSSFYGLDITGISVGGKRLSISSSVFTTAGAVIDSGTVITRLPPTAYSALRSAFQQGMRQYPTAKARSILDTCYDLSKYKSVRVPKISFFFRGGVAVTIPPSGIFYGFSVSQVCLAFAANGDDSDVAIFGNVQQKTLRVVHDGVGQRIGFAVGGCK